MKIKVYAVDLELPPRLKRWGVRTAIWAAAILCGAAGAYAALPKVWVAHEALTSHDLNENFDALDKRISATEKPVVARYTTDSTQALAFQLAPTTINFDQVSIDTDSAVKTGPA